MTHASHRHLMSRRWWDALAGFGATSALLTAGTEILVLVVRTPTPATGPTTVPLYLAGGAAGAIAAWAGRDAFAVVLFVALLVVERSIRFASQLQAFALIRDPSVLEVFLPQVASIVCGAAIATLVLMLTRARLSVPRNALALAGVCFAATALALLPLRLSALGLAAIEGSPRTALTVSLAALPVVLAVMVAAARGLAPIRSALLGAVVVVASSGPLIMADVRSRPFDDFALAQSAPLLAAALLAFAAATWPSVEKARHPAIRNRLASIPPADRPLPK